LLAVVQAVQTTAEAVVQAELFIIQNFMYPMEPVML
jgi:hypothetical protein